MHSSLRHNRSFVWLWLGQVASNIGDQFYSIALIWYLLQQVDSPSALSLLTIPEMVAGLLFTLLFGAMADRLSPRSLMIWSDIARFILALIVFGLMISGASALPLFMGVQFGIGLFMALFHPARTVAVRSILPPEQLSQANAIQDTTFRAIRIAAPMTVAALAVFVPLHWLVLVNSFSYALSALCISRAGHLRPNAANPPAPLLPEKMTPRKYARDILEGMQALASNRTLLYTVLFANLGFLAWQVIWTVGFPVLASGLGTSSSESTAQNSSWLGIIVGFYGAGNLLGSLVMTRLQVQSFFRFTLGGWLFMAAGFGVIAVGAPVPWLICIGAALAGIGGPVIGIPLTTAIQTLSEPRHTGKVYSLNMLSFTLFCILSAIIGSLGFGNLPAASMFGWGSAFLTIMILSGFLLYSQDRKTVPQSAEV